MFTRCCNCIHKIYTISTSIVIVIARLLWNELLHSLKWLLAKFAPRSIPFVLHINWKWRNSEMNDLFRMLDVEFGPNVLTSARCVGSVCAYVFESVWVLPKTFYICLASNHNFTLHSDKQYDLFQTNLHFHWVSSSSKYHYQLPVTSRQHHWEITMWNVPPIHSDNFKCIHTNKLFIAHIKLEVVLHNQNCTNTQTKREERKYFPTSVKHAELMRAKLFHSNNCLFWFHFPFIVGKKSPSIIIKTDANNRDKNKEEEIAGNRKGITTNYEHKSAV